MNPKADPYATRSARTVDAALVLFALAMIAFVILTAPRHQPEADKTSPPVAGDVAVLRLASNTAASSNPLQLARATTEFEP